MKRFIATLTLLLVLASASMLPVRAETADVHIDLEVREKMFLAQINEIFINMNDYLGKTIALEGMFSTVSGGDGGPVYHLVYRKSPGCCGNDGIAGLEVLWDDPNATYPTENDWVRAVGVLEQYDENGTPYLRLRLISLDVKTDRGLEFVNQ